MYNIDVAVLRYEISNVAPNDYTFNR